MKKIFTLTIILIANGLFLSAQDATKATADTSWKKGGFISISFNQVSLTNWAAGGENALSGAFVGSFFANYKKGKIAWDNTLDLGYGMLKSDGSKLHKNDDRIELNSTYGHEAKGSFYYSALLNMKSQFAKGYNYPNDSTVISKFAAPAYISIALGMEYKPTSYFSLFLSPATGRLVVVSDQTLADAGQFGVDPATYDAAGNKLTSGKMLRTEFGAYLRTRFQKDLIKNVNLFTTVSLFNNYTDKHVENRGNINVDWLTMLTVKAGKLLSFNITTHLLYDNNIAIPTYADVTIGGTTYKNVVVAKGPKTQFQEALGVGISYKF